MVRSLEKFHFMENSVTHIRAVVIYGKGKVCEDPLDRGRVLHLEFKGKAHAGVPDLV